MDTGQLQHGPDAGAGNDTRSRPCRNHHNATCPVPPHDPVGQGALDQLDGLHVLGRVLPAFLYRGGYLSRLTIPDTDVAVSVTDDNQGTEAEPATSPDHCSAAADLHHDLIEGLLFRFKETLRFGNCCRRHVFSAKQVRLGAHSTS